MKHEKKDGRKREISTKGRMRGKGKMKNQRKEKEVKNR
jgi:hypothetical protein